MSQRVRCGKCQTAFLTPDDTSSPIECPKCGARHRLPETATTLPAAAATVPSTTPAAPTEPTGGSVFVPSEAAVVRRSHRRWLTLLAILGILTIAGVAALIAWPRLKPRPTDPVERVAEEYLTSLVKHDQAIQRGLSTIDDPPAIQSFQRPRRERTRDQTLKGSFAPLANLHRRIETDFDYDPAVGRFTPRNPLGAAAETLDVLEAAKEEAKKSGIYEKMASGDPDDIFDAAENYGKMFSKLAAGALAPKKILPKYQMLVNEAKPPIPPNEQELAALVGDNPKTWEALLKRPFHTLKADGPFILDRAEVTTQVTDQLASLGDPPATLRLSLVRFRLEGIDTRWRIIAARRVLPGSEDELTPPPSLGNPGPSHSAGPPSP